MINDLEEVQWAYLLDPTFELVNTSGKPLTGGWLEVYIHGTRTKYYCASDFDGTLHPFKIPLDSLGANIVLASPAHAYDVYVYNIYGNLVMSRYNVVPSTGDGTVVKDVVNITSNDGTVNVESSDQTNWDLSIKDTVDTVELLQDSVATAVSSINERIDNIESDLSNKKDKQAQKTFTGSQTKTITSISQNPQGVISVTYDDIDLPPEVPNIELTSPNGTINIASSVDISTNTKTFEIDLSKTTMDFFDGYCSKWHYEDRNPNNYNTPIWCYVDQWSEYKYQGDFITNDWQANNNINFVLKPGLYLITATIRYDMHNEWSDPSNPNPSKNKGDEYIRIATGAFNGLENGTRYKDWSHEYQLSENTLQMSFVRNVMNDSSYDYLNNNTYLYFNPYLPYGVNYVYLEHLQIVKLDSVVGASGTSGLDKVYHDITLSGDGTQANPLSVVNSGSTYSAGSAIDLTNDKISVKVNPSSGIDIVDDKLVIKVGNGLTIDPVSGVVIVNSEVGDVIETVEKLKQDLDTQITTNFDMPNISQVYDFADSSNWMTANGACMLYQAFTIPINHEVRTVTDDADTPTLLGIYAQQSFGHKIMLALYEYQYAAAGEEHGSSTYVGDTGPVTVLQGVNEYPLKNRNPSITELRSDRVYYAALYLPSTAFVNGLYLAGCPSYGNQSVPAEPRLSCATENITWENQELDMDDPTTTLNHYQVIEIPGRDPYYQYYIGPWVGGYNERWSSPRFYMQIRNGEYNEPVIPTEPFTDLGETKLPRGGILVSNLPNFSATSSNSGFRDVTPMTNVTITAFEWIDNMATVGGWEAGNCVYNSDYSTNLSGVSNSVVDLGEVFHDESYTAYRHRITFTTPITLTANVTYRFLCTAFSSSSNWIWSWTDPTDVFDCGNNGWYVDWNSNVSRYSHIAGQYLKLYDNNNHHWVI